MHNRAIVLGLALILSACDNTALREDFAVAKAEPVAASFAALGASTFPPEMRVIFPGLKLVRTRPDDTSVLYTIPASGGEESTILLTFETAADGRGSMVHAAVHIPAVRASIAGQQKVISEAKIERELQALITDKTGDDAQLKLSALLAAIAIATDAKAIVEVQRLMKDPQRYGAALEGLRGDLYEPYDPEADADSTDRVEGSAPQPASDPDAIQAEADHAARETERREERRLSAAAAAGDDAAGEAPEPELPPDE